MQEYIEKKATRIDYIDLLRSLGILLMIMGHIPFGEMGVGFDKWIHAFHMPLFFLISGYFYKRKKILDVIRSRFISLIVPYLSFGLFHIIIMGLLSPKRFPRYIYCLFYDNTANEGVPIAGAIWFLTALFFSDIIFSFLDTVINRKAIFVAVITVISVLGMLLSRFLSFHLPYGLDAAMVGTGLIFVGSLIRLYKEKIFKTNILFTSIMLALFSISSMLNGYVNMRIGNYGILPLFWINAIGMSISLWNLCRIFDIYIKKIGNRLGFKWIYVIGRDSIIFLCLNQLAILITKKVITKFIVNDSPLINMIINVFVLIMVIIELLIISYVIRKVKLGKICGLK